MSITNLFTKASKEITDEKQQSECTPIYDEEKPKMSFRPYYSLKINIKTIQLEKSFWQFGSLKPDPYCRVTVNNQFWDTDKIANVHTMDWHKECDDHKKQHDENKEHNHDDKHGHDCTDHLTEFILLKPIFRMKFEVMDDNDKSTDDVIGEAQLQWDEWSKGFKAEGDLVLTKDHKETQGKITVSVIGTVQNYESFESASKEIKEFNEKVVKLQKSNDDQKKQIKEWKQSQKDYIEQVKKALDEITPKKLY